MRVQEKASEAGVEGTLGGWGTQADRPPSGAKVILFKVPQGRFSERRNGLKLFLL